MSTVAFSDKTADVSEEFNYRPLSTSAVASAVFALLSTLVFFAGRDSFDSALLMLPIPLIGLALGWKSLSMMRANADQFSGGGWAKFGLIFSAVCFIGGVGFAGYLQATEVPPGYLRATFTDLRPDEVESRGDHAVPAEIAKLNGEKVFIKGYMRPGTHYSEGGASVSSGIASFLLVRDNNQCCFGDISSVKYYDQMVVACKGKLRLDYNSGLYRIGGTLRVFPENAHDNAKGPTYALEADYAK
jgi:hypothetical protein